MANDEFVSLHNHTDNSILDGYSKPSEYISRAVSLGQRGLGITDHGNLFGIFKFLNSAKSAGITGIPGCEFYMAPLNPNGAQHLEPVFYGSDGGKSKNDVSSRGAYLHLTVWAYNNVGLYNLFKLSTLSNDPSRFYKKPRIDFDLLAEHSDGLIVATGCPSSEISTRFLLGQDREAYDYAGRLKEVFGDRLFVEIMDHDMSIDLERKLLPKQLELSKKMGIPLLATNDCHYAHEHDAKPHEEMLAIQSGSRMADEVYDNGGSRFAFEGTQYYLKTADQMSKMFPEEDFPNAISNTLLVAEMATDLSFAFNPHLKPKPILPEGFDDEVEFYKHLINKGFKERYGNASAEVKEEAVRRNKQEFKVIHSSDFIGYMLVVRDYLEWAKKNFSTRDELDNILASSIGVGRGCFEPGSMVITDKGHKTAIENIKIGSKVRTHDTTYQVVEDLFVYDVVDEPMVELALSNGEKIKSTSDHMIFKKDVGFIEAKDLNPGDALLSPKRRRETFAYSCDNCRKTLMIDKQTLDIAYKKGYYKPVNEYWCYDCVKGNIHLIPGVSEALIKGSLRNKDPEVKKKNSDSLKKHWSENREYRTKIWRDYAGTQEYRDICSKRNIKRYKDPAQLEKLSKMGGKSYKNGYFVSHRQEGKKIYYASSYELKALNILETDSSVKSFDRARIVVPYNKSSTGRIHKYLPDFCVEYHDGRAEIIEVKAKWQLSEQDTSEKLEQAESFLEENGFIFNVWTEDTLFDKNDAWHDEVTIVAKREYVYTGKVYDIQVANVHNYTVSGVTVHNSVGGSIHAFELGISEIDPIKHDLLFERFLSAGRGPTYRLTYDDGTTETIVVSERKKVEEDSGNFANRYIHQLSIGDTVVVNDENKND